METIKAQNLRTGDLVVLDNGRSYRVQSVMHDRERVHVITAWGTPVKLRDDDEVRVKTRRKSC